MGKSLSSREIIRSYDDNEMGNIICDPSLLARALELVLENSVKFSPEESPVAIKAVEHETVPDIPEYARNQGLDNASGANGWIEITVSDRGEGIEEREIPFIFQKFKQLGDIMTTKPSGVGLGLSIARAIIERHHGAIWATSRPGEGSSLHILLPGRRGEE